jgi:hypothetical protein
MAEYVYAYTYTHSFGFCLFEVLRFEHRASYELATQALYHLSHSASSHNIFSLFIHQLLGILAISRLWLIVKRVANKHGHVGVSPVID